MKRERFGTAGAPFSPALADACVVSAVRSIDGMSNVTYKIGVGKPAAYIAWHRETGRSPQVLV